MTAVRHGTREDLEAVGQILAESPEAGQWAASDCLAYDFTVAVCDGSTAGFLVTHTLTEGEYEILNLAVARDFRRRGIARALLRHSLERLKGDIYLEVRASNAIAQALYKSIGFEVVNTRPGYYSAPREAAIVLNFHSC